MVCSPQLRYISLALHSLLCRASCYRDAILGLSYVMLESHGHGACGHAWVRNRLVTELMAFHKLSEQSNLQQGKTSKKSAPNCVHPVSKLLGVPRECRIGVSRVCSKEIAPVTEAMLLSSSWRCGSEQKHLACLQRTKFCWRRTVQRSARETGAAE